MRFEIFLISKLNRSGQPVIQIVCVGSNFPNSELVPFTSPNGARPAHLINTKGHCRLSIIQSTKNIFFLIFCLFIITLPYFFNLNLYSSFVSTVIEGDLAGLPMLEQPNT
jgi:hypothetical protein